MCADCSVSKNCIHKNQYVTEYGWKTNSSIMAQSSRATNTHRLPSSLGFCRQIGPGIESAWSPGGGHPNTQWTDPAIIRGDFLKYTHCNIVYQTPMGWLYNSFFQKYVCKQVLQQQHHQQPSSTVHNNHNTLRLMEDVTTTATSPQTKFSTKFSHE